MLLDPGTAADVAMFKELSMFVESELKPLVPAIAEQFERVKRCALTHSDDGCFSCFHVPLLRHTQTHGGGLSDVSEAPEG